MCVWHDPVIYASLKSRSDSYMAIPSYLLHAETRLEMDVCVSIEKCVCVTHIWRDSWLTRDMFHSSLVLYARSASHRDKNVYNMAEFYWWHESFLGVTWLIHVWITTGCTQWCVHLLHTNESCLTRTPRVTACSLKCFICEWVTSCIEVIYVTHTYRIQISHVSRTPRVTAWGL